MNRYIADVVGLPPKRVMWFVGTLSVAMLIVGTWVYAEKAYPHGPMVHEEWVNDDYPSGRWVECDPDPNLETREGGCRSEYYEDTSQLNNPDWVRNARRYIGEYLLFFQISILGFGTAAVIHGGKLVELFRIRRKLFALEDNLRFVLSNSPPTYALLFDLFRVNRRLRRWEVSSDFLQQMLEFGRAESETRLVTAKLGKKQTEISREQWRELWQEHSDEYHIELEFFRNRTDESSWPRRYDLEDRYGKPSRRGF
jgi:hypothetical protein